MIKAVLFDMDGVLIDSHDAWFDRYNASLKHFGFDEINDEEFDKYVWAVSFKENAKNYFPGIAVEQILGFYHKTFDKFSKKIKKMKSVENILKILKEKNFKIGLTSNTTSTIVRKVLQKINIQSHFDIILGGEQIQNPKPDPEIILKACQKLNIKPREAVLVGDTVYDEQAAKAAGCGFIGYKMKDGIQDLLEIEEWIRNAC
jgi:HAD superfamily hydrolase (TIGR01549 family)